jgi:Tol biopolymer transport system component
MLPRHVVPVLAALTLLPLSWQPAQAASASSTAIVDRPSGFGTLPFDGNNDTELGPHAISADGRFVVFSSDADTLSPLDDDSATNIFRLDRQTGQVAQADTTDQGGQPTPGSGSGPASISANGRFVAFDSNARNLTPDAPPRGTYVKDLDTGAIVLASRSTGAAGEPVDLLVHAVISGDGRHVAFTAIGPVHADNATGVNGQSDAYVRNLDANTTHMASVSAAGAEAGSGTSAAPDIDFGGDAVAFITTARLDNDDGVNDPDAYVRTGIGTQAETTRLASIFTNQVSGHATAATQVALSSNGSGADLRVAWVAIETYMTSVTAGVAVPPAKQIDIPKQGGTNAGETSQPAFEPIGTAAGSVARLDFLDEGPLDPADTNGRTDAYSAPVATPGTPATLLTSGGANADVEAAVGASDGTAVFMSRATDLPGGDGEHFQSYVRSGGVDSPLSGTRVSDAGSASLGNSSLSGERAVSDDGRVVAFSSDAGALGSPFLDGAHVSQVLVRDVASGQTTLISSAPDGAPADDESRSASVDAAGDRVAFESLATNLSPEPKGNHVDHAYVRDVGGTQVRLIDRTAGGQPLSEGVSRVEISPDGGHAVYVSDSPDAPGAPAAGLPHVYVVDLASGQTLLVDRATDGTPADDVASDVAVSGDGSKVAFASTATNLGAGAGRGRSQVYVRDLTAGTTVWISRPAAGGAQNSAAQMPSIDRAGARVAFQQDSPDFGFGMTNVPQIFVRDVAGDTPDLASRGPDDAGNQGSAAPSLSADGTRLSFQSAATNFPAAVPGRTQVYLRDLKARSTTPVSLRDGSASGARLGADEASLSGNGACVAFRSFSDDLVAGGYGPDFSHAYLRAVTADCPPPSPSDDGGGGTGAGGGGTGAPPRDTVAPRISHARLIHRRFAVAARRTALSAKAHGGTTIAFTLSEKARTTIAITRRKGHRTVTLFTLVRAHLRVGAVRVAFSGRTRKGRLKPGAYRARLVARDSAGNRSRTVTLRFAVIRRSPA